MREKATAQRVTSSLSGADTHSWPERENGSCSIRINSDTIIYPSVSDSPATLPYMNSKQKKQIARALDVMATRTIAFTWEANYTAAHDAKTSDLGGLKPGSRQDSDPPNHYWVGMFKSSSKKTTPPPLIEASFQEVPDTATAVAGLRAALEAA